MSVIISIFTMICGYIGLNMPAVMWGLNFMSPLKWGSLLVSNVTLRGASFTCLPSEQLPTGLCPLATGVDVLSLYKLGLSDREYSSYFWILALNTCGYLVLAFAALRIMTDRFVHR